MSNVGISRRPRVFGVLVWEHWRRGWWWLLNAQIGVIGLAIVVYSSLQQVGPVDDRSAQVLHMIFLWSVLMATGGAALMIWGDARRYFRLPLSSSFVSAIILLPGMICVATAWAFLAALMNWQFRVNWPWAGPSLFMAAFWGAIQLGSHIAGSNRLLRFFVWTSIPLVLGEWLCRRYEGTSLLNLRAMWSTVSGVDALTLAGLIVLVFLMLPWCIIRERCGEAWLSEFSSGNSFPVLDRWIRRALTAQGHFLSNPKCERGRIGIDAAMEVRPRLHFGLGGLPIRLSATQATDPVRFSSAAEAQFWFEWRQKGRLLPATLAVFLLLLVAGYACRFYGEYELLHSGLGYGIGLVPLSLVMGLVLGHVDLQQKQLECSSFLGTRPFTNWQLSLALLKVEAASLSMTWGAWCGWLVLATIVLYASEGAAPVFDLWTDHGKFYAEYAALGNSFAVVLVGIGFLLAWIGLALASSLALTGRRNWLIAVVSIAIPVFILMMAMASENQIGSVTISPSFYQSAVGIGATFSFVTILAVSRFQAAIDRNAVWNLLALAVAGAGVAAPLFWYVGWRSGPELMLMLGTVSLAVAPWAAAPLALSWNRHR